MKKIAIIGSGDLGQLIAYHCKADKQAVVVGFFDDFKSKSDVVDSIPVLGGGDDILTLFNENIFDELILAIGYKHFDFRASMFEKFQGKIPFAKLIHSSCFVDASCKIEEGVCLLPGSTLDRNVIIQSNVLINVGCTIAHDSNIGAHSFLSPSVAVAGFVKIGSRCNIGINATIIDNVSITNNTQIGGGTVVISNLEKEGLYVGNPARFIR